MSRNPSALTAAFLLLIEMTIRYFYYLMFWIWLKNVFSLHFYLCVCGEWLTHRWSWAKLFFISLQECGVFSWFKTHVCILISTWQKCIIITHNNLYDSTSEFKERNKLKVICTLLSLVLNIQGDNSFFCCIIGTEKMWNWKDMPRPQHQYSHPLYLYIFIYRCAQKH